MDYLTDLFLNNRCVVLIVTLVGLVGGITTIVAYWKPLCADVLKAKVTLPVYAYLIIIFFGALSVLLWSSAVKDRPKKLRTIEGEAFGVQRVIVDGKRFVNCTFRKTELVFRGEARSAMEGRCLIIDPTLTFEGPAAGTMRILRSLYKVPELRPRIENTFEAIRKDKFTLAIPPSDAAND